MKINKIFLTIMMLTAVAFSSASFAASLVPNPSGETEASGEELSPSSSAAPEETTKGSGDVENILSSEALDSSFTIKKNSSLEAKFKATIENEESVSYAITVQPTHGVIVQSGDTDPNFKYTPEEDYVGEDSFSFRLESGEKYSNVATITITIKEEENDVIPFNYLDMQNHWANYSASHLAARGLILGEEIGNRFYYYPENKMTRGDFMLFLLAITESNLDAEVDVPSSTFADKDSTPSYLLEAAKVAYSKKIIQGSSENGQIYLNLNAPITRSEAITMISNVLDDKSSVENITYKDVASIPEWALKSVKNLSAYKIIQGDEAGTFRPNDILTRAEAAELSFKLLKQLELINITGNEELK